MEKISNNQIDKYGEALKGKIEIELEQAKKAINDWRLLHKQLLDDFKPAIISVAKNIDVSYILAQRLKKIKTIEEKLQRPSMKNLKLSTMQDIAGSRVVLSTIADVKEFVEKFVIDESKYQFISKSDYLAEPRNSGYRGIHLIYKNIDKNGDTYGLKTELQVRTRLQHMWATAVETASFLSETQLKASEGNKEWLRLFALVSSIFAYQEKTNNIPNIDENLDDVKNEIIKLNQKNNFIVKFEALTAFVNYKDEQAESANYYLLYINSADRKYRRKPFNDYSQAYKEYINWEEKENGVDNVVLVSTNSLENLKEAYPNYFADMKNFIAALKNIVIN